MKRTLFFLYCLSISVAGLAQGHHCSIRGKLVGADGSPVSYLCVALKALHVSQSTDENGEFIFRNLGALTDSIVILSVQYQKHVEPVHVCCGAALDLGNIILQDNVLSLENIEIRGARSNSYKSNYTFSATKTQAPLKSVPQTISVVPAQLMRDRMDYTLTEAIENVAGVNLFSDYEEYTIRGFRAENPRLINGLRTYNATLVTPMLANIEKVEVIKGPASVLYSNTDAGGVINMVTKKPTAEKFWNLSFAAGSWDEMRLASDVSGPINKDRSLQYRFNAAYRTSNSFRNQLFDKSFQLAPSFSFTPGKRITFNIDLDVSHSTTVVDRGQPGLRNSRDLSATPARLSVSQPGDQLRETDLATIATVSYKISDRISLNSSFLNYSSAQHLSEHGIKSYVTDDSAYLYYTNRNTGAVTNNVTNYIVLHLTTGAVNHQFLAGYDLISGNAKIDQWNGEVPGLFGVNSGIVGTFSLVHPLYFRRPVNTYTKANNAGVDDNDDAAKYLTQGVYIQDQLSFRRWEALVSLRGELYKTGDDLQSGNLSDLVLRQHVLLPRVGVTYKWSDDVSLYATWNRGFEPFEASSNLPAFGGPFRPIYSQLLETGIKSDVIKQRLSATFSIYRIKQTNVLVNANDPSQPDRSEQAGASASTGIEMEANGNISPNLSMAVSYAYNVTRIIQGNNPSEVGKPEVNAPRNLSSSWIQYRFPKGFAKGFIVAVGHSQVSKRNTYTDLTLPGYHIFNASVAYNHNNITIRCNFNNITNSVYYEGAYNNINKWPGKPFNMMVAFSYQIR